jgi:hypothetical protein
MPDKRRREDERVPEHRASSRQNNPPDEPEHRRLGAGAIVGGVGGGVLLLWGLTNLPRVLGVFAEEDAAHAIGRLTFVVVECVAGVLLVANMIRQHRNSQPVQKRPGDTEDEGW